MFLITGMSCRAFELCRIDQNKGGIWWNLLVLKGYLKRYTMNPLTITFYNFTLRFQQFSLRIILRRCSVASKPSECVFESIRRLNFFIFLFPYFLNQMNSCYKMMK